MLPRIRIIGPVVVVCSLVGACSSSDAEPGAATVPPPALVEVTTTAVATSAAPTPSVTFAKVVFESSVAAGSRGDEVAYVQQRLKDLGFDPGPVDGQFGTATTMAVWAYQKLLGLTGDAVDGRVTPELWSQMQDPLAVAPKDGRSATSTHVEIDLVRQLAIVWNGTSPALITHISSGSNRDWCENGWCGVAITPPGAYSFTRRISGWRQSELGLLYNPVYFNGGVAVHGAENVPLYPASHGCIRIPMHVAEYFPSLVDKGDEVLVFDGVADPREYGQIAPPVNVPDPETTTTLPPVTVVPDTVPSDSAPVDTAVPVGSDGAPVEGIEDAE